MPITTKVRQPPSGDFVVDIDQAILDSISVKEGDFIEWGLGANREAYFRKFKGLEMCTIIGMGRMIFTVPAPGTRDGVLVNFQDKDMNQVSVISNMFEIRSLIETLQTLENQMKLVTEVSHV